MNFVLWTALISFVLYLAAAGLMERRLRRTRNGQRRGMLALGSLAVCFHAATLWPLLVTPEGIRLAIATIASLVGATGAAFVIISCLWRRLEWISVLVFPLSALTLPPALLVPTNDAAQSLGYGLGAHVLLSVLAYAVFGVAAAHAIFMTVQHRQLKHGHIRGIMHLFPPVQVMESMLFEMLWLGMGLLIIAMATGLIYVDGLLTEHLLEKTLLSVVTFVVYAVLLSGRYLFGWRSRTAVRMTLAGFVLLVLTFFGSRLVMDYLLAGAA